MLGECKLKCLESANTVCFSHFQSNEVIGECQGVGYASAVFLEHGGHSSIGLGESGILGTTSMASCSRRIE